MSNGTAVHRILLLDDEPALREVLGELLTAAGYRVTGCGDGHAALELVRSEPFDAVLSDISMPGLQGLDFLRAVRQIDSDLPVVLLTGGPSIETAVEAISSGALDYLIKPVRAAKLIETMSRAVKLGALARLKREALGTMGFDQLAGERAELEAAFDRALGSLWMACQPIVRAGDGTLYGHEALVRTREERFPNPGTLFAAAERLGRLRELGTAVRAAVAGLLTAGAFPGPAFVNLHPVDLTDDAIIDPEAPLSRYASSVVLEITERASLDGVPGLADRIRALRALGFRIAIDDLGAGYAGLTSLAALSPEVVKLDLALIRDLDGDGVRQKLVSSIAAVCGELGMLVVAEGIETSGEREAAERAGCGLLQGYLFGRPGPLTPS